MAFDKILDHAIKHNLNVLLRGKHGVGKTAMIKQAFTDAGLRWKYYSAATMDPWVDFIGVPKEKVDESNGNTYLELVRPKELALDEVDAIFFDELNRSHKKIRNAVMELIQFKSINGKPFKNLKVVWAAVNPDDDADGITYDVEKMDDAQLDRFEIQIDVPYKPDTTYFTRVYGKKGQYACKWWTDLKPEMKPLVSPRRLEYALVVLENGGDIRYVLNNKVNAAEFQSAIAKGDPVEILNNLVGKSKEEITKYFMDNNSLKHVKKTLFAEERFLRTLASALPEEELLGELRPKSGTDGNTNAKFQTFVANNAERFSSLTDSIIANKNSYSDVIYRAFIDLQKRKAEQERKAIEVSKTLLTRTIKANELVKEQAGFVTINGKQFTTSELTVDNYEEKTGRRFRVTATQHMAIQDGTMSREEAFAEFIDKVKQNNDI